MGTGFDRKLKKVEWGTAHAYFDDNLDLVVTDYWGRTALLQPHQQYDLYRMLMANERAIFRLVMQQINEKSDP